VEPVPVGSLVNPFIALAYAQQHNFPHPTYFCDGTGDGCWLPRGHGQVDISAAIESAFRRLVRRVLG
jgi:cell division protein FtsI/penicillin-binding protein 2